MTSSSGHESCASSTCREPFWFCRGALHLQSLRSSPQLCFGVALRHLSLCLHSVFLLQVVGWKGWSHHPDHAFRLAHRRGHLAFRPPCGLPVGLPCGLPVGLSNTFKLQPRSSRSLCLSNICVIMPPIHFIMWFIMSGWLMAPTCSGFARAKLPVVPFPRVL